MSETPFSTFKRIEPTGKQIARLAALGYSYILFEENEEDSLPLFAKKTLLLPHEKAITVTAVNTLTGHRVSELHFNNIRYLHPYGSRGPLGVYTVTAISVKEATVSSIDVCGNIDEVIQKLEEAKDKLTRVLELHYPDALAVVEDEIGETLLDL